MLDAIGQAGSEAASRWRDFAQAHWSALAAPDQATAGRLAEMACKPARFLYGAQSAATAGVAR